MRSFMVGTFALIAIAAEPVHKPLQLMDVFRIEYAADPQITPDGKRVVYVRNFFDVKQDRRRSNLWIVNADGIDHEALTTGNHSDYSPRWSPDGKRLAYLSDSAGTTQLWCCWLDTGRTAKLTNGPEAPSDPVWSPDGKQISFSMHVAATAKPFVDLPNKPVGAEWAEPFKLIRRTYYRDDGKGYRKEGYRQLFVLPSDGGTPRQLTDGPHDQPSTLWGDEPAVWTPDGKYLIFAANRHPDAELNPLDTELYEVNLVTRQTRALTDRRGPDHSPAISPDGKHIAYLGYNDEKMAYQQPRLFVCNRDGTGPRRLLTRLDRPVKAPLWSFDGKSVNVLAESEGDTQLVQCSLTDLVVPFARNIGGVTLGRPYASGSFSVARAGVAALTHTRPNRPANVAIVPGAGQPARLLTQLNESLASDRALGDAEAITFTSGADKRQIQGWLLKPPGFDPKKKYPLILEIHGGPFADYGERFALELQLYAAAGYVVLYVNPRGSTGYGEEFAQLIHHAYPGHDFDDLMAGVDAVIAKGSIDPNQLYVTGGSGGGILTCWTVGKTKRFRAAVACFPVVNWSSFALNTDVPPFFTRHWFPGPPWEHAEHYRKRSPLFLAGSVTTPTMLLTGEEDYRCPISESEQFYMALRLRKVDTALVRVPHASHNVSARPSHLIAKVAYILRWFETHRGP